ncbi:adenosine deaminase [Vibrio sp. WJH972]
MINRSLPLTDIHRHLDGNIRTQTIIDLGRTHDVALPSFDIDKLTPYVQVVENEPSLIAFLSKLDWGVKVLGDLEACRRIAIENVEDVFHAGIDYAELRFSPYYMALEHQLPLEGVVEAVIDGVTSASKQYNLPINLIGIMSRTFGQKACQRELEAICAYRDNIIAIDLAGDELNYPSELFLEHFKHARDLGFHITAHAGEAAGSEAIWHAINELGAERIGHGVKAIEDPKLLEHLAQHQIGIESCLTSNIQTTTVLNYENHPVKAFLDRNICVSLNTDDPAVEGIELPYEYQVAAKKVGLTQDNCETLQKNGLEMAFLSENEKQKLIDKVAQRA